MKLNGSHFADFAEIQEDVTDEIKKIQKEDISAGFRNCTAVQNPTSLPLEIILNKKKDVSSSFVFNL